MKHETIRWNPATNEWYCSKCGRASDHASDQEAGIELEQYDCDIAWVEMPKDFLDRSGDR